jgi:SAM-dependent methyltransferase
MSIPDPDAYVHRLAAESLASDDPTGWFERLYSAADEGAAVVPWDRGAPHPLLLDWARARHRGPDARDPTGRRALVVGCGLGADAEYVAGLGYRTTAFDVSPSAVAGARRRFPASAVAYRTADLLDPPAGWAGGFDLVVESYTVQSLPPALHPDAIARLADLVGAGGTLLLVAMGRAERDDDIPGPPWPLTPGEVAGFTAAGLVTVAFDDLPHPERAGVRRWRYEFRRP